jgi:hypothetical protein
MVKNQIDSEFDYYINYVETNILEICIEYSQVVERNQQADSSDLNVNSSNESNSP